MASAVVTCVKNSVSPKFMYPLFNEIKLFESFEERKNTHSIFPPIQFRNRKRLANIIETSLLRVRPCIKSDNGKSYHGGLMEKL